ncbi:MAG TPA: tautomerase family protein [Magnetospirillum sp.]|nr:tautomerase family protein [Magnetospirillum sp.]
MPAVNLVLPDQMPDHRRNAVSEGVHLALVEEFGVPRNGKFHMVSTYNPAGTQVDGTFLGVPRGPNFSMIQIFVMDGHSEGEKRNLIRKIRANLLAEASLTPEDLFINIVDSPKENWFCMVK